jgi:hypothetical protein
VSRSVDVLTPFQSAMAPCTSATACAGTRAERPWSRLSVSDVRRLVDDRLMIDDKGAAPRAGAASPATTISTERPDSKLTSGASAQRAHMIPHACGLIWQFGRCAAPGGRNSPLRAPLRPSRVPPWREAAS